MNPPRLEVTTSNETLQFDLPEGNAVSQLRINGQELHDIHAVAMIVKQHSRAWTYLGVFLVLSAFIAVALASWLVVRVNALPTDTAEIQTMLNNQQPPAFAVGAIVRTDDGHVGVVQSSKRNQYGRWVYQIEGSDRYREQPYLTFLSWATD